MIYKNDSGIGYLTLKDYSYTPSKVNVGVRFAVF